MSIVKERIIKIIQKLPYNIDEEIYKKDAQEILQDITKKYIDIYGTSDMSDNDKDCIKELLHMQI